MTVRALSGGLSPWDILRQRRAALEQMEAAVQSGDMKTAQESLATVKKLSVSAAASEGAGDAVGDSDGNPFRATMKADLSALEFSVPAGNFIDAQEASYNLAVSNYDLDVSKAASEPQDPAKNDDPGAALATDMINLIDAVLKGDAQATQKAATALQSDLTNALEPAPEAALGTGDGPVYEESQSAAGQSSLIDDLKALLAAGKGTDANATQQAAQKFLQNLQQAAGAVQGGGQHHQGHHAHAAAQYEQTVSMTTLTVTSTTTSATAADAVATAATS